MMQAVPLAGRYRFLKRLSAGPRRTVWLAEDIDAGMMVVAVRLAPRSGQLLDPVVGVQHPHLACLLDVVHAPSRDELPDDEPDRSDAPIAVAEWVSGKTLYDALMQECVGRYQAVQCVAYVASAVAAVHQRRAFHGAISARSVVLERVDDGPGPVLTQVIMPADGSYASPERLAGGGPSQADDVWALHVLLYAALTGQRPFRAQSREALLQIVENPSPVPLEAFGIQDTKLQAVLDWGFRRDVTKRRTTVHALETELFQWLSAHSAEQGIAQDAIDEADRDAPVQDEEAPVPSIPPDREADEADAPEAPTVMTPAPMQAALAAMMVDGAPLSTETPPEADPVGPTRPPDRSVENPLAEPPAALQTQKRRQEPRQAHRAPEGAGDDGFPTEADEDGDASSPRALPTILGAIGLLAVLAAAAGGYVFVSLHGSGATSLASADGTASGRAAPVQVASTATVRSSVPSATPSARVAAPVDVTGCVAGHFSPDTFDKVQDLRFVCEQADPRVGAETMRSKIVLGSRGKLTEGVNLWPRLGWHELVIYGMLRRKCCAGAPSIALPDPVQGCPPVGGSVNAISAAHAKGFGELDEEREAFIEAATCAHRLRDRSYRYRTGPLSGGQVAFERFLKRTTSR